MRYGRTPAWLLVWLLGLAPLALALAPDLALRQFVHDSWNRHDGLPSSGIQCIAQTTDGYIWLGTAAGLVRFDGVQFTEIPTNPEDTTTNDPVVALCPAPGNSLWIGTRANGIRLLRDGVLQKVPMGTADPNIASMYLDEAGQLVFGTHTHLYLLPEGRLPELLPTSHRYFTGLSFDNKGRLWAGAHGALELQEDKQWRTVIADNNLISACLLSDSLGNTWVGTANRLLRWQDGKLEAFGKEIGLLSSNILSLYQDHNGDLWVGTTTGLHRFKGCQPSPIGDRDRIPLEHVAAMMEDREGSLWVGTDEGLHRFKNVKLIPWTIEDGIVANLTPSVNATPDGDVFVFSAGDPNGIARIHKGRVTRMEDIGDGPSCITRDGSLWVAMSGQLIRIRGEKIETYGTRDAVPSSWISAIVEDDEGLILAPIGGVGLKRWSPGRLGPYLLKDGSPFTVNYHVQSATRLRDGSIAMATYDGLWLLRDGTVTRYTTAVGEQSQHEWYKANPQSASCFRTVIVPGLQEYWFTAVAEDERGRLWLASQRGGLHRLHEDKAVCFTTREGLHSNQVYSVLIDNTSALWLSSPRGLFRVPMQEFDDLIAGRKTALQCEIYGNDDGMKSDEGMHRYQPAACKAPDGSLWFATKHGVVCVYPELIQRNTKPPPVIIENIEVDRVAHRPGSAALVIEPGSDKVDIHFTALSLLVPERVRFRYQLEGYDKDWVLGGRTRTAHYTRLPPGSYRFRVIACNNDGVWNYEGATARIEVLPRFHQTLWFALLCSAALGGLVFTAHRVRVRSLRLRERELQARVDTRTAELSDTNQRLRLEVNERIKAEQEVDRVHKQLMTASHQAGMAEIATGVLHNIGNVLNSVNVSASVIANALRSSKAASLQKLSNLLSEHQNHLPRFFAEDPKARQIPPYLSELAKHLTAEQAKLVEEIGGLQKNVEHIKDIVAMQQTYATVSGLIDTISPTELVEDALRMHQRSLDRHHVRLVREFDADLPPIEVEKHKVLQILVNLIQNAKQACEAGQALEATVRIRITRTQDRVRISISDNGVGIPPQNLTRIFNHGFTTKKGGHGFGLHSSSLSAKSLGGSLEARSEGTGKGSTFTLELPITVKEGGT